jgi:hypothetical protein
LKNKNFLENFEGYPLFHQKWVFIVTEHKNKLNETKKDFEPKPKNFLENSWTTSHPLFSFKTPREEGGDMGGGVGVPPLW